MSNVPLPPPEERLLIARDLLRNQISDRYRITLTEGEEAAKRYDATIALLQGEVEMLEREVEA